VVTGVPGQWYSIMVNSGGTAILQYIDVRVGGYGSAAWNYGTSDGDGLLKAGGDGCSWQLRVSPSSEL
jgi:hypothetical protein